MRIGISTYSLYRKLKAKEMNIIDVLNWIAEQGVSHVELVALGYSFVDNDFLIADVQKTVTDKNLRISNYAVDANFVKETSDELEKEVERIKNQVDIAAILGAKHMRFDAGWLPPSQATIDEFERRLPNMAAAIRQVAKYAEGKHVRVSVENHGYFVQHSDRVLRLIEAVNHPNYSMTVDVGNFLCVDEDPYSAVKKVMPYATMLHVKDFYRRKTNPGEGWFPTFSGRYLRGAIIGNGDIDLNSILQLVKEAGYDGDVSVEFEGLEDDCYGTKVGLENFTKLLKA